MLSTQTAMSRHSDRIHSIRLLVLDIDGTIAGSSNTIREPVLQAIQAVQATGVAVAIATGRMFRSAKRFHQMVGSTLPLMAYQGAWIQDPIAATPQRQWSVPATLVAELLDYFEQPEWRDALSIHCYLNDELYVRTITPTTHTYAQRSGITPHAVGDLRQILPQEPTKLLALCEDTQLIQHLLMTLKKRYDPTELYLTTSVDTFLEATNPDANKGAAVRYLAEEVLGLAPENVMAIGDNFNDLEMLQYAGIGVAMGDAPDRVKAIAQWVAPGVEEDGAVAAISQFLL
jgi:Cof subfamily protein (haloacid dehalogenase superfamily)